jgi:hypothetical protein
MDHHPPIVLTGTVVETAKIVHDVAMLVFDKGLEAGAPAQRAGVAPAGGGAPRRRAGSPAAAGRRPGGDLRPAPRTVWGRPAPTPGPAGPRGDQSPRGSPVTRERDFPVLICPRGLDTYRTACPVLRGEVAQGVRSLHRQPLARKGPLLLLVLWRALRGCFVPTSTHGGAGRDGGQWHHRAGLAAPPRKSARPGRVTCGRDVAAWGAQPETVSPLVLV